MKLQSTEKKHILNSFLIAAILIFVVVMVFVFEQLFGANLYYLGVMPRQMKAVSGIITVIFVHADWVHLFNNSVSLFVLTSSLFFFYRQLADKIFVLSWFFSGLLLWVIGRESWHVGASGLIYALAFFLGVSGFLRRHIPLVAISMLVVLFYGNMIWHVFPWQKHDPISWEGHLSGAIVGVILAFIYLKQGPQKQVKGWDEDALTDEEQEFAEYAESFELEGEKKKEQPIDENDDNGFYSSKQF